VFAAHKVDRDYIAIVSGLVGRDEGEFKDDLWGKKALTHYKVVTRDIQKQCTLVKVTLNTGRRNQIRIHFADSGHPVLGDHKYRSDLAKNSFWTEARLALHARLLGFIHPITKVRLEFVSRCPIAFGFVGNGDVEI